VLVLDERAYCSFWTGGFAIYDVRNPSAPVLLGHKNYAGSSTHNAWPSADRRYLYTTDENVYHGVGGHVKIWDLSNLSNIVQVGSYKTGPVDSVVHNAYVIEDLLFVAYYKEGLRICSLKDPINPVEIAHYDTYPSTGTGCFGQYPYAGCWGVYAWDLTRIFVSDLDSGGYIFSLDAIPHSMTARNTTVPPGNHIELDFAFRNASGTPLDGFGVVFFGLNSNPYMFPLLVDFRVLGANQSVPSSFKLPVPNFPTGYTVDFAGFSGGFAPFLLHQQSVVQVRVQ
jgi:hypothetical protein